MKPRAKPQNDAFPKLIDAEDADSRIQVKQTIDTDALIRNLVERDAPADEPSAEDEERNWARLARLLR